MTHPTDALRLVPVPFNLLSEAAGLLDCEGYGPISSQLNALLAAPASPLPGVGDKALIAELKEARGLITDIAASKITEDNPYIWKWASEVIIKARAFLARNGKGEG